MRIAGIPVLTPSDLVATARAVLGWTDEAVEVLAALPGRASALLDDVERLVARIEVTVDRVDEVTAAAGVVAAGAGTVVDRADAAARGAAELLALYGPTAERGAPLLRRFVEEFSEEEMTALVRLVDQVPRFTEHMVTDIMPILATLDRVGPDVHELLAVLKDVRLAIEGVPGFALFKRRGEEKEG